MNSSLKIMVVAGIFSAVTNSLFAEWKVAAPAEGEMFYDFSNLESSGPGEVGKSGSFKIKYLIDGKWHVACEADVVVNEKGKWYKDCKAPIAGWPTAKGPAPTPYMIELYDENKILKHTNNFKVLRPERKPK